MKRLIRKNWINVNEYIEQSHIYLKNQNKDKLETLKKLEGSEYDQRIEFKKINPIKYRVRLHGIKENLPIIFNESYNEGWKIYTVPNKVSDYEISNASDNMLDKYRILDNNDADQADREELTTYLRNGWISTLGDYANEKSIQHKKWENNKEQFDYSEKYYIDFISKDYQNTIQNENLFDGRFYETWLQTPVAESDHLTANGYSNSWLIDPQAICNDDKCKKNEDGTYDIELIMEFWPQRLFYIGSIVSGMVLLACLAILGIVIFKKRKKSLQKNSKK